MKILAFVQGTLWMMQLIMCGFSFPFLFTTVARALFAFKLIAVRIPMKAMIVLEVLGVLFMVLIPLVFGWRIPWIFVAVSALFAMISVGIICYDEYGFVYTDEYVVEPNKDDEGEFLNAN